MTEKEHEFKMLLTNREYQSLLQLFDHLMTESEAQTNYLKLHIPYSELTAIKTRVLDLFHLFKNICFGS